MCLAENGVPFTQICAASFECSGCDLAQLDHAVCDVVPCIGLMLQASFSQCIDTTGYK